MKKIWLLILPILPVLVLTTSCNTINGSLEKKLRVKIDYIPQKSFSYYNIIFGTAHPDLLLKKILVEEECYKTFEAYDYKIKINEIKFNPSGEFTNNNLHYINTYALFEFETILQDAEGNEIDKYKIKESKDVDPTSFSSEFSSTNAKLIENAFLKIVQRAKYKLENELFISTDENTTSSNRDKWDNKE